ncbi:helix-turn-helix domain-containing protein [Geodermatophilus sp. DSM 44513]|uniref:winged helix-turn-helix transcriptional regulator n=1 Tax=Geodermatophilus sp. DSM 44513 TaxID=1528104 RepID=UPI001274148F|nr:helix-turn-helix domain-containing protein [Geodermatophilus sp. DSM 44513]WNV75643.1 helix-turn-helix domain-containing protein [Geodermatophilus sp. DSM 44513]
MTTRTAAQHRAEAKEAYDAFLASCPARHVLSVLSDKWVGLVVSALGERPKRYSELRREIAGVSQKMLTQTLRSLEREGLVQRTVTAEVPVRVDYRLTDLGGSLLPVLQALKTWSEQHVDAMAAARERYDSAPDGAAPDVPRPGSVPAR